MQLVVDCPPLPEPAYVDRDMWEKIVLNLVSNAFKFTLEGRIAVSLRDDGGSIELRVEDTGTGIPADELPRLFERFHRVEGAQGRTHEGTGIGLALVQELARLHGGRVEVESTFGAGSAFTVTIPTGTRPPAGRSDRRHARRCRSTAMGATPYVEEAFRWLPDPAGTVGGPRRPRGPRRALPTRRAPTGRAGRRAAAHPPGRRQRRHARVRRPPARRALRRHGGLRRHAGPGRRPASSRPTWSSPT